LHWVSAKTQVAMRSCKHHVLLRDGRFAEALHEIASVTGRSIRYQPISGEAYGATLAPYLPAAQVSFLVELFEQLLDGHNALLSDGVERALGRKPRAFSDYVRDAARVGAWQA
jgi:hypothetical protein